MKRITTAPEEGFDPLEEVAMWLSKCAENHRFFATTDDASMTQNDHAWFARLFDELAEKVASAQSPRH